MLLVIDVGNTHTAVGIFEDDKVRGHWRISTNIKKPKMNLPCYSKIY